MKALVTGGGGFIGSRIVDQLLTKGYDVAVLDDFSTGRAENLTEAKKSSKLTIVKGSVLDSDLLERAARGAKVIFHLAAVVGVKPVFAEPIKTIQTNVVGTNNVLEMASRGRQQVFLASSSELYGKGLRPGGGKFMETDEINFGTSLRWNYAASKAINEFMGRAYHRDRGVKVVIGRYFNTVGPRQTSAYGMVIPNFVQKAISNEPITVYGDGKQVRAFTWVGDTAEATIRLMEESRADGEIFNIGNDEPITILGLAKKIVKMTKSRSRIVLVPYEKAVGSDFEDIRYRVPNVEKLASYIRFRPRKSLDDILKDTIQAEHEEI